MMRKHRWQSPRILKIFLEVDDEMSHPTESAWKMIRCPTVPDSLPARVRAPLRRRRRRERDQSDSACLGRSVVLKVHATERRLRADQCLPIGAAELTAVFEIEAVAALR